MLLLHLPHAEVQRDVLRDQAGRDPVSDLLQLLLLPRRGLSSITTRIFLNKLEEPRAYGFDYGLPSVLDFQSSPDSMLAPIDDIN